MKSTCANSRGVSLENCVDIWHFVRWTCVNYGFSSWLLGFRVDLILGGKHDFILNLHCQFFDNLRETSYKHPLKNLKAARSGRKRLTTIDLYKGLWLSEHIVGASASPRSSYGGQHDTKYMTFELLLYAVFVAHESLSWYAWNRPYRIFCGANVNRTNWV